MRLRWRIESLFILLVVRCWTRWIVNSKNNTWIYIVLHIYTGSLRRQIMWHDMLTGSVWNWSGLPKDWNNCASPFTGFRVHSEGTLVALVNFTRKCTYYEKISTCTIKRYLISVVWHNSTCFWRTCFNSIFLIFHNSTCVLALTVYMFLPC